MDYSDYKLEWMDEGFCIAVYSTRNSKNEKIYYGIQKNFDACRLMRCSVDGEPSHEVKLRKGAKVKFDKFAGLSSLERDFNNFIWSLENESN